jgi:hypothetical protein
MKEGFAKKVCRYWYCMYIGYDEAVSIQIEQAHIQKLGTFSVSCMRTEYAVDFGGERGAAWWMA